MDRYFLVIHNTEKFPANTLVKYKSISDSGKCYLVSDLRDNLNREWIMYYSLNSYEF